MVISSFFDVMKPSREENISSNARSFTKQFQFCFLMYKFVYLLNLQLLPWTLSQQGVILGAFFWGYIWLQILIGNLSRMYGPKYFLFGAMLVCSITTILSPLIAQDCSWVVFCISQVVIGLSEVRARNSLKIFLQIVAYNIDCVLNQQFDILERHVILNYLN